MRVAVDRDLCEANGVCTGLAPEIFDLDDEDYLHILAAEVPAAAGGRGPRRGHVLPETSPSAWRSSPAGVALDDLRARRPSPAGWPWIRGPRRPARRPRRPGPRHRSARRGSRPQRRSGCRVRGRPGT